VRGPEFKSQYCKKKKKKEKKTGNSIFQLKGRRRTKLLL
jgi:hypothetical protein